MVKKTTMAALAITVLMAGCATKQAENQPAASTPASTPAPAAVAAKAKPSAPGTRIVKSKNGKYDGEIIGTPGANSKFAKLQIGMRLREVSDLIGAPDDLERHETGKRWIPFYFGPDAQRLEVLYKGEGCLTYTGGNVFGGGGNELIRITVDQKGTCQGG
jgi:hypothetical protein